MPSLIRPLARVAIVALLAFSVPMPGASAMDQEKHDNIRLLIQTTGSLGNVLKVVDLIMPQIISTLKKVNPKIPPELWDTFEKKGAEEFKASVGELEEPTIAIYDTNYSADEIKQLLTFYQSPIGQKVISQTPTILQESAAIGKVWGEKVGRRIVDNIRQEAKQKGYDL
jgi:hypothetical protein